MNNFNASSNLVGFSSLHGHNVSMYVYAVLYCMYSVCNSMWLLIIFVNFRKLEKQIDEAKATGTD